MWMINNNNLSYHLGRTIIIILYIKATTLLQIIPTLIELMSALSCINVNINVFTFLSLCGVPVNLLVACVEVGPISFLFPFY